MSGTARENWMKRFVSVSLGCSDAEADECFATNKTKLEQFLKNKQSEKKLFFFCKEGHTKNAVDEVSSPTSQKHPIQKHRKLHVAIQPANDIIGKAVYFIKSSANINLKIPSDENLLAGEIHKEQILQEYQNRLENIFLPSLEKGDDQFWGRLTEGQAEFTEKTQLFSKLLKRNLASLAKEVHLPPPNIDEDLSEVNTEVYRRLASDSNAIDIFRKSLSEWEKIAREFISNDPSTKVIPNLEENPEEEIEWWIHRSMSLTKLLETIERPEYAAAVSILRIQQRELDQRDISLFNRGPEQNTERSLETSVALKKWEKVKVFIEDALHEAKDNEKFLKNLRKFIKPLYRKSPSDIISHLPALFNSLKLILSLSRYYATAPRMTNLIQRIGYQITVRCSQEILNNGTPQELWDRDASKLITVLEECVLLKKKFVNEYYTTKKQLRNVVNGYILYKFFSENSSIMMINSYSHD